VTIKKGTMIGSFSTSPLSCKTLTATGVPPTLTVTWKGNLNGSVTGRQYAGKANLTPTWVSRGSATGSFAGPAAISLPFPGSAAASCGSRKGIKKLNLVGTVAFGGSRPGGSGSGGLQLLPSTLAGLGAPTAGAVPGYGCGGLSYRSVGSGAALTMAGQRYPQGFQLLTDAFCGGYGPSAMDTWSWHIGDLFGTFTGAVGLDSTNSLAATLQFLACVPDTGGCPSDGDPLTFYADGQSVTSTNLVVGIPTNITMNVTGILNLIVETTVSSPGQGTLDFANKVSPPPTFPSTLEGLGAPTDGPVPGYGCGGLRYTNVNGGASLVMGGQHYDQGFQLLTDAFCGGYGPSAMDTWAWHIGSSFRKFTVAAGLDATNSLGATLQFLACVPDTGGCPSNGNPLTFYADGQSVTSTNLVAGVPTDIAMNVTGVLNLIVDTTVNEPGHGTVDFANDSLTNG